MKEKERRENTERNETAKRREGRAKRNGEDQRGRSEEREDKKWASLAEGSERCCVKLKQMKQWQIQCGGQKSISWCSHVMLLACCNISMFRLNDRYKTRDAQLAHEREKKKKKRRRHKERERRIVARTCFATEDKNEIIYWKEWVFFAIQMRCNWRSLNRSRFRIIPLFVCPVIFVPATSLHEQELFFVSFTIHLRRGGRMKWKRRRIKWNTRIKWKLA